jgi:hypothetical protein
MAERRTIDKEQFSTTCRSIRFNRELGSNEINESDFPYEKDDDPRTSTFRGLSIDSSDEYKRHLIHFESTVNLIHMKLMKVIYNARNMMT